MHPKKYPHPVCTGILLLSFVHAPLCFPKEAAARSALAREEQHQQRLKPYVFSIRHPDTPNPMRVVLLGASAKHALRSYVNDVLKQRVFPTHQEELRTWSREVLKQQEGIPLSKVVGKGNKPLCFVAMDELTQLLGKSDPVSMHLPGAEKLSQSGGEVFFVPPGLNPRHVAPLLSHFHHATFIGGEDVGPVLYGEERTFASPQANPRRDRRYARLIEGVQDANLPSIAFCRSHQITPIVLKAHQAETKGEEDLAQFKPKNDRGPGLIQDLTKEGYTTVSHKGPKGTVGMHPIAVFPHSYLSRVLQLPSTGKKGTTTLNVNTWHHQGVEPKDLPPGYKIEAVTADGNIEAASMRMGKQEGWHFTTQFHPELDPNPIWNKLWSDRIQKATSFQNTNP